MASAAVKSEDAKETSVAFGASPPPVPSPPRAASSHFRPELMVKTELDAARALADLARLVAHDAPRRPAPWDDEWGNKGRRSCKRIKTEARARSSDNDVVPDAAADEAASSPLEQLGVDQKPLPALDPELDKKVFNDMSRSDYKVDQPSDMPRMNPECSTINLPFRRGKSKQVLSEAEREAKRICRVLANRESARQTILRRQAFCEELTRKAADLTCENENLKQKHELVKNEYRALKDRNEELKMQVALEISRTDATNDKVEIKHELEAATSETISTYVEKPTSSRQLSQLVYSTPSLTFVWPPVFPLHNGHTAQYASDLKDMVTTCVTNPYHQWALSGLPTVGWPRMPFCTFSPPWFCPPSHWFGAIPTYREREGNETNHQCDIRFSSKDMENTELVSTVNRCKDDASSSTDLIPKKENASNNFTENLSRSHTERECAMTGVCAEDKTLVTSSLRMMQPSVDILSNQIEFTAERENDSNDVIDIIIGVSMDGRSEVSGPSTEDKSVMANSPKVLQSSKTVVCKNVPETNFACEVVTATANCISTEKILGENTYPCKQQVDLAAAAEARKRRKELTKLKNNHARQLRLHC